MNIEQYLNRINYSGTRKPTLSTLRDLQYAHLLNIPFENLDIHYDSPIKLNADILFHKIVKNHRGGFCYELNGLFYELLTELGYNAKRISAKVFDRKKNTYGPEFDHMAVLVEINNKEYLTDVGFGDFTFHPLMIELNLVQEDMRGNFIIEPHENGYYRVSKLIDNNFEPEYIFSNTKRNLVEFESMCHYHQTSPDSHFTQKRLISKPTRNGRITISGGLLKITENDILTEQENIESETDFVKYLNQYFGIKKLT